MSQLYRKTKSDKVQKLKREIEFLVLCTAVLGVNES